MTLEEKLVLVNQRPAGFDYMRLILATLVVLTHSVAVGQGLAAHLAFWGGPIRPIHALVLPMFFALSGFLVAGSIERCRTLISFIGLRVLRILPALLVETTLSAMILGVYFTKFSYSAYFEDPSFRSYFLNILGQVHFSLPGVYLSNPMPGLVNGQLWTLPFELKCYAILAVLAAISVVHRPKLFIPLVLLANIAIVVRTDFFHLEPRFVYVNGKVLIFDFIYGLALFLNRTRVPWSGSLAVVSSIAALGCLAVPGLDYISTLPVSYLTVYLGLLNPRRIKVLLAGDYSYGIFLYGYPIQQAVVAILGGMMWWENMLLAFPVVVAFAAFSWWVIEKPALSLRKRLMALEDRALSFFGGVVGGHLILRHTGIPATAARPD
jgi:peptidoglycan/LPS O-acetylase OafA/YrhL